jgi:hypothetical protein
MQDRAAGHLCLLLYLLYSLNRGKEQFSLFSTPSNLPFKYALCLLSGTQAGSSAVWRTSDEDHEVEKRWLDFHFNFEV